MRLSAAIQNRGVKGLLFFAFWTLIGLSFACQFHISTSQAGLDVSWKQAISYALADWYVFAVLSLPVIRLARVYHFEAGKRGRSLAVHAAGSALFSGAYMVLRAWVGTWQSQAGFLQAFQPLLVKTWHFNLLLYWVMVAVACAFDYYRKYRDRELRTAELENRLAQARLQALQMQLNPHFLFNSLHSISALMHKDIEAADRMISRLGELLRAALDSSDAQEVSLRQELDFVKKYLELEQIRFGNRLVVRIEAAPETLDAQVPNLILQPLVENAIRHGIEPHARAGQIKLQASRQGDGLALEVHDNGEGLPQNAAPSEGVGLSNTRARLRTLYGDAHEFEMRGAAGGGLMVRVLIPFRTRNNGGLGAYIHESANADS
ncbi:MAG TPA: histidine kinase [Verrucomicrobiae bacterium]